MGEGECCHDDQFTVEDSKVVRSKADELARAANRARAFGYGLMLIAVMALVALVGAALYQGAQVRQLVKDAVSRQQQQQQTQTATADVITCLFGKLDLHQAQADAYFSLRGPQEGVTVPRAPASGEVNPQDVAAACQRATAAFQQDPTGGGHGRPGG